MISVEHLCKTYRITRKTAGLRASIVALFVRNVEEITAVDDLSFQIHPGERVGFLGPNGAGKTTTLKMLSGLLTPTSGKVLVLDHDPRNRPRALLRQITLVMGQKQQLIWDLPPIETLELNRAVYEIDRKQYKESLDRLVSMLDISSILDKPTRQLSLGERMKCELAAALLHQPRVLFLDEPTIGLDVTMQAKVRRFIRDYNEATGATVILTSHYMDDVAALCPRVIVIDQGRLRHDGELRALVARTNPNKLISMRLHRTVSATEIGSILIDGKPPLVHEHTDAELSVSCPPEQITEAIRKLLEALPVADLRVEDPPLEETMRQVFGRKDEPENSATRELPGSSTGLEAS